MIYTLTKFEMLGATNTDKSRNKIFPTIIRDYNNVIYKQKEGAKKGTMIIINK